METRGEEQESPTTTRWGTWEELLLVSAVNRHGAKNWDSVAMEIQNRLTSALLTPHNCKQRYQELRRRFDDLKTTTTTHNVSEDTDTDTGMDADTVSWIEELRKLRVAELRREVQQYDVSIVSLQLKVKRLREEREKSFNGEVKPDLEESEKKVVSGENSDREYRSFNESNSTDPKRVVEPDEKVEGNGLVPVEDLDPVRSGSKPVAEGSYNSSTETVVKDSANQAFEKSVETIPKQEPGELESPELWESVAESKGDKENSDVQSSASLSKETRREKEVSVSSSGDDPETDEISPAMHRMSCKSGPLEKFLEILKSHKYGYVFERRLESQEASRYTLVIRLHLDLETINNRLKEGQYSGDSRKFFRDLLLVFNNAIVFFPRNSEEYTAAVELRQVVSKEMSSRTRKLSKSLQVKLPSPAPTLSPPSSPKIEAEPFDSLPIKPSLSTPLIACRKCSSISSKGAGSVLERKVEKKDAVVEVKKSFLDQTLEDNLVANLIEDNIVIKKGKRDRPPSGTRSSRAGSKNQKNSNKNSNLNLTQDASPSLNPSPSTKGGIDIIDNSPKVEKEKKNDVNTVAKKRSVANFLNRMKKNISPNGPLLESLKNTGNKFNQDKGGNAEQKKSSGAKGEDKKEQASKQGSSRKQACNQNSPTKRNVGRPPKGNASSPVTPPVSSKRSRKTVETEGAASKQPRKRSRR